MLTFHLYRIMDVTGVSGEGVVAEGVQFTDGRCVLRWLTDRTSIAIYNNLDDVRAIHGHDGNTLVIIGNP